MDRIKAPTNGGSGIVIIRYAATVKEKFMAHFAKVKDGIVIQLIVAEQELC